MLDYHSTVDACSTRICPRVLTSTINGSLWLVIDSEVVDHTLREFNDSSIIADDGDNTYCGFRARYWTTSTTFQSGIGYLLFYFINCKICSCNNYYYHIFLLYIYDFVQQQITNSNTKLALDNFK